MVFLWFYTGSAIFGHPEIRETLSFPYGFPMVLYGFWLFSETQKHVKILAFPMDFLRSYKVLAISGDPENRETLSFPSGFPKV